MKKLTVILLSIIMLFSVIACNNGGNQNNNSTTNASVDGSTNEPTSSNTQGGNSSSTVTKPVYTPMPAAPKPDFTKNTVIYLAGDSTVKTYAENTFIGGWGQFMHLFLKGNTVVENKSNGGRSSRSFINEGRLTTDPNKNYTSYQSIESTIKEGDYLFIQFGHNDDATRNKYDTFIERQVPLGEPDEFGIFPTTMPTKVSTDTIPKEYIDNVIRPAAEKKCAAITDEAEKLAKIEEEVKIAIEQQTRPLKSYGSEYYSYDCGGTYKGYLKMYIDFARSKGAIPVLCTPVARVKFDSEGKLMGGNGRHGENFAYVQAVRQLAQEECCLMIDTFEFTKNLLEKVTKQYADYLMALKPNSIPGQWAFDYDYQLDATGSEKKWTGIEATHYNRFGAFITAAYVAETLQIYADNENTTEFNEKIGFAQDLSVVPSYFVECPSHLSPKLNDIKGLFQRAQIVK